MNTVLSLRDMRNLSDRELLAYAETVGDDDEGERGR